jgi:hypothetical protein
VEGDVPAAEVSVESVGYELWSDGILDADALTDDAAGFVKVVP